MSQYYVYIVTSKKHGTLYTGMTSDLVGRIYQHKAGSVEGFTKKYEVHSLVYYEVHHDAYNAITREKQVKKWRRAWKIRMIEKENPNWEDLYESLV